MRYSRFTLIALIKSRLCAIPQISIAHLKPQAVCIACCLQIKLFNNFKFYRLLSLLIHIRIACIQLSHSTSTHKFDNLFCESLWVVLHSASLSFIPLYRVVCCQICHGKLLRYDHAMLIAVVNVHNNGGENANSMILWSASINHQRGWNILLFAYLQNWMYIDVHKN
jgi:hypothetical protein